MNKVLLSKIEDVFDITGRGIILAPGFPTAEYKFDKEYQAEIEAPDGSSKKCKAKFLVPFQSPPPKVLSYFCHLSGIEKNEIPISSKLWLIGVNENDIRVNT